MPAVTVTTFSFVLYIKGLSPLQTLINSINYFLLNVPPAQRITGQVDTLIGTELPNSNDQDNAAIKHYRNHSGE